MTEKVYEKTGWKVYNEEYPFITDTRMLCQHIGMDGQVWPKEWPERMRPV